MGKRLLVFIEDRYIERRVEITGDESTGSKPEV
jgi:hypothetical protein